MEANYLYGKKYVALGDRFTEGDFKSYFDENGLEGTYMQMYYAAVNDALPAQFEAVEDVYAAGDN